MSATTAQRLTTWGFHVHAREIVAEAARALGPEAHCMPLKGVLLGALEIVHPAERPLRDVDLLIANVRTGDAMARLGRAGFRIAEVPWAPGYIAMRHDDHKLWLDLHTLAMPIGFSRLTRRRMFEGARVDDVLFGARVYVPSLVMLSTHLVANIVKDRVVHAYPHAAIDLAACARSLSTDECQRVLQQLTEISLSRAGALALAWAHDASGEPRLATMAEALVGGGQKLGDLRKKVARLANTDHGEMAARLFARTASDDLSLRLLAPAIGALGVVTRPLRRAWLQARNRGDAPKDMR